MEVVIAERRRLGDLAAELILQRLRAGQLKVPGVATGSSPVPVHRALAASGEPSLSSLRVFALDEYADLPHDRSF